MKKTTNTKKNLFSLVFVMCIIAGLFVAIPLTASAYDGSYNNGKLYYNISDNKATITDCIDGVSGSLTIPSTLSGYPVTVIQQNAFYNCNKLTSISIPDSVTSIGSSAFYGCSSLESITFGKGVTSVAKEAFTGTAWYNNQPDGLVYAGKIAYKYKGTMPSDTQLAIKDGTLGISDSAFYGCSNLENITIPNSVTIIGNAAFYCCSSLTNLTIPNSVTRIDYQAFYGCSNLTNVVFGNGVTSIGDYAFSYCSNLESVTIPDSVTSIGYGAFSGCSNFTSMTLPFVGNTRTSTGTNGQFGFIFGTNSYSGSYGVYYDNSNSSYTRYYIPITLKTVTITDAARISEYAFRGCYFLTGITIPDGVKIIGYHAFSGCSGLTSITIPDSVTSILSDAFSGCSNLTSMTLPFVGNSRTATETYGRFGYIFGGATYTGSYSANGCCIPTTLKTVTITDTTQISAKAFYGCSSLTDIILPDNINSVGQDAFTGTAWYNNQPDGMVYVGKVAYKYKGTMPSNTQITLKDGTLSISGYAFSDCSNLTRITIPNSVTSIGSYAFSFCSSLTSITVPDSVTSIGSRAFNGCSSLTSITIPFIGSSRTATGDSARFGYIFGKDSYTGSYYAYGYYIPSTLKRVTITGATQIPQSAFYECSSLMSVSLPNGLTSVGDEAFYGCGSLTRIAIPSGVTSIGYRAFCNCGSLSKVTIPDSVNAIGFDTFYGTEWLKNQADGLVYAGKVAYVYKGTMPSDTQITLKDGTLSITDSAFKGCSNLTSVTIPSSVTSVGVNAFYNCSKLTSISIPDSVTSIGSNAFYGCSNLKSATIGNGVTSIGYQVFYGCSSLESATIGNGVTSIGYQAFYGCSSLTDIIIPSRVTEIGQSAFCNSSSLVSISIPKSVQSIKNSAFYGCNSLSEVCFEGTEDDWWDNVLVESGNTALLNADYYFESYPTVALTYEITASSAGNGIISADKQTASQGETVTLTVIPSTGYQIKAVKYNDTAISPVEGVYSFIMPEGAVTITAEFEQIPVEKQAVSITDTDSYKSGAFGGLRFITDITNTDDLEIEYYGTWMIPQALFASHLTDLQAEVKTDGDIKDGQYTSDLLNIPSDYYDTEFVGISFVKFRGIKNLVLGTKVTSVNESYKGE